MAALDDKYIVFGAKTECSMGLRESKLVLPADHGIFIRGEGPDAREGLRICDECNSIWRVQERGHSVHGRENGVHGRRCGPHHKRDLLHSGGACALRGHLYPGDYLRGVGGCQRVYGY